MNYPNSVLNPWLMNESQRLDEKGFINLLDEGSYPKSMVRHFVIGNLRSSTSRGGHAHRLAWQILCNASPEAKVTVVNLYNDLEFLLDINSILVVPPYNWISVDFLSPNSRLMVLSSEEYDPSDYIYDAPSKRNIN
jgi:hypothetical protein